MGAEGVGRCEMTLNMLRRGMGGITPSVETLFEQLETCSSRTDKLTELRLCNECTLLDEAQLTHTKLSASRVRAAEVVEHLIRGLVKEPGIAVQ